MQLLKIEIGYCFWLRVLPTRLIPPTPHILVKTGMSIRLWFAHVSMFDWIVVDVVQMIRKVTLVPNDVIPKTTLP